MNYDPFVKEDFILPEKWYVSVTNETLKDINIFKSKTCWKANAIGYKAVGYEGVGYNSPLNDYTEITFEQFKKYVLKEPIEQSKSIEKWSVGSYVVFLKDFMHINTGYIDVIKEALENNCVYLEKYLAMGICRERLGEVKWFATKSEAEEFAKTLVKPVKEVIQLATFPIEGYCKTDNVELRRYLTKRPNTTLSEEPKWIEGKSVGVGWNERSHWVVSEKSSKPEYQLNQLEKFFTKEEINQHLISIGQIPAGEPLNTGIEPNKDDVFRFNSPIGSHWTGLTPTNHLGAMYQGDIMSKPVKPKMTLSIDDEELPMVSIIKTNSIKQLLSND